MNGIQWARVVVCMLVIYLLVELEKALVDPVMVPLMKPLTNWVNARAPKWLKGDLDLQRTAGKLCKTPRTKSMAPQRKGTLKRTLTTELAPGLVAAAEAATGGAGSGSGAAARSGSGAKRG